MKYFMMRRDSGSPLPLASAYRELFIFDSYEWPKHWDPRCCLPTGPLLGFAHTTHNIFTALACAPFCPNSTITHFVFSSNECLATSNIFVKEGKIDDVYLYYLPELERSHLVTRLHEFIASLSQHLPYAS